jgi:phage shock protein PspC (stress-responsive transcriptional regulator)
MTSMTDELTPPSPGSRNLRRSDTERVVAGVAGGLGEYFDVDPVLFRVLFGVSAFFGGFGILAYLVAWAVMPESDAASAPLDRAAAGLRHRRIPALVAIAVLAIVVWAALFSWWSPWPFWPLLVLAVVVIAVLDRRRKTTLASPRSAAVDPAVVAPEMQINPALLPPAAQTNPWIAESRRAARQRWERSRPVRVAGWSALALSLLGLGIADAVTGIRLPVYFWVTAAIAVATLVAGAVLRRPVWGIALVLPAAVAGLIGFGGTAVSLHDGSGDRLLMPTAGNQLPADYRMAFGRTTLDLTALRPSDTGSVRIRQAAGQVKIILPASADVRVHAGLRFGTIQVDGREFHSGVGFTRDVVTGSGNAISVDVRLENGAVTIEHRG